MHLPPSASSAPTVPEADVWAWYLNVRDDLKETVLTPDERASFAAYYKDAGLLRAWRRSFFRRHYSETFWKATTHLFAGKPNPLILDLGCGTGTQALYFALRGARVLGVDMDTQALAVLTKRKRAIEASIGKALDIEIIAGNVFEADLGQKGQVDGVYSLFAFNMMQLSDKLVEKFSKFLAPSARIAILDGNNQSWIPRLVRSRRRNVWSPAEFSRHLKGIGFNIDLHEGGVALPPPAWWLPASVVRPIDRLLGASWFFAFSHLILATRK